MAEAQQPKYKLQHLIDYLSLYNHIYGKLPNRMKVPKEFYDWYKNEAEGTVKRLGVNVKMDELKFDDIRIELKKDESIKL